MLMNLFPTFKGTLKNEKENKGKDDNIEFMRQVLPAKDKTLCFQRASNLENLTISSFK